jgi:RNA polymerase sigma-70 factor (ECF subfamily)
LDGQHEAACQSLPVSWVACSIAPGLPEGIATWVAHVDEDVPPASSSWPDTVRASADDVVVDASLSPKPSLVLACIEVDETTEFKTTDPRFNSAMGSGRDIDYGLVCNTQAYLRAIAARQVPDRRSIQAWERFFEKYDRLICRTARAYRMSSADLEDCVQAVWEQVISRMTDFTYDPHRARFCCWILRIIRNRIIDFVRALGKSFVTTDRDLEILPCHRHPDPAITYERHEKEEIVSVVLDSLERQISCTDYQVIHLRWIEECSVAEVAAMLDIRHEQVWYRQHRTRRKLYHLLEADRELADETEKGRRLGNPIPSKNVGGIKRFRRDSAPGAKGAARKW